MAPDLGPRPMTTDAAMIDSRESLAAPSGQWPSAEWWQRYNDPQLDALITEAEQRAPTLALATARVRSAEAMAMAAGAALWPTLSAQGRVLTEKQSYNLGIPAQFVPQGWHGTGRATVELGFDPDLWGRNRALLAAATSDADAARLEADQARLMLATEIAAAYTALSGLYLERDVAARAIDVRADTLKLATERADIGLDNRGPQQLAASRLAVARADLAAVGEAIGLTRNRIAALVGAGPDRGLAITRPSLAARAPFGLPANAGLDLIGRRPDIMAARLRTESAARRIKAARAAYYPNINISGLIGVQSVGLDLLTREGSLFGAAGPAISLPLFAGRRLSANYRGARAGYDAAVADYDAVLVDAIRTVADAVTSLRAYESIERETAAALTAAEAAHQIARKRYEGGLSSYLDALNAEDTLLERRRADARVRARTHQLDIALVRALGGGFAPRNVTSKEPRP